MPQKTFLKALIVTLICACANITFAQPTWTIDLLGKEKKPEKFENRKLGSEKMADKKFTLVRNFFQNNYTHYNYYFNAKNKINAIIERAKASQVDDYTKLLSFYPYALDNTLSQKSELDSVIYKATAGILLHDLRNDWVDNMYLLMGQAYFFRKDFDTAAATFQFINYNLFPRKKNEDDSRVIGTRDEEGNTSLSIANKEKQNILQKATAKPPSRNDALIWIVRTLIEQGETGEAAGLISTLQQDPNLPQRLQNDLNEVNAYWFYSQNIYDSAAVYLEKSLSIAETKQDLARVEFLLAQLYEMTNKYDLASSFYEKVSTHTVDPLMDIHARLNNAKMRKGTNPEELDYSIANLVKMARKDKFEAFRDILFYSAGDLAMEKPDSNLAISLFNKSLQYNENNISYKNKAFLQLADMAFNRKQYKLSYAMYDSLQTGDTTLNDRLKSIQERRNSLVKIVEKIVIIEREDSLQHIAAMPVAERELFIKKMVKRLRKEQGLKDVENNSGDFSPMEIGAIKDAPIDLFTDNSKGGEWYFYNNASKTKGYTDFKRKWGNRKNVDDWRRKEAASSKPLVIPNVPDVGNMSPDDVDKPVDPSIMQGFKRDDNNAEPTQPTDISYEGMMAGLPLTPEQLDASKTLVAVNLFDLAKLYQNELEDYEQAILTYDQSLERFPDSLYNGELYLGLYFCYNKLGLKDKAAYYKNLLNQNFASSNATKLVNNPGAADPKSKNPEGTKRYADIYTLFIEGNFDKAFEDKKNADSIYGNNYWSPQLLYIEAVYHIRQREDSLAIDVLNNIVALYTESELRPKAERMIDVLGRRAEIENYLTNLQITRAEDADIVVTLDKFDKLDKPVFERNDNNLIKSRNSTIDTNTKAPPIPLSVVTAPVIVSPDTTTSPKLVKIDTLATIAPPLVKAPVIDSIRKAPPIETAPVIFANGPFIVNTTVPHNVIMVLDKVDGTYVNESKNAFARYLNESFRGEPINLVKDGIDKDRALLVFSGFANAQAALDFLTKVKKAAPVEVSWLPANKYSFLIISDDNLGLLKASPDIPTYIGALNKAFPGKF